DVYENYGYKGRVLYKMKRYKEAADSLRQYCDHFPADNETLYVLCQSYKRDGAYAQAAEICERLTLREPGRIDYLVNLADCHRLASNWERAHETMRRAAAIDPENPTVHRMNEILEKRGH
ncbi:MAG: tetratricopeptide repeat protein, partial [Spirochaetia bacterium]|nr:tetratricopeptide repeat protein [Spirochaetia bacterium]